MTKACDQVWKEALKKHACYVLITCDTPNEEGFMEVNMTYEGDTALAAYLLQGAQALMDQQEELATESC